LRAARRDVREVAVHGGQDRAGVGGAPPSLAMARERDRGA
jgi:hypothetical protein